jgi:hypothetical protein
VGSVDCPRPDISGSSVIEGAVGRLGAVFSAVKVGGVILGK